MRDGANEAERMVRRLGRVDGLPAEIRRAQYEQSLRALRSLQRDLWGQVDGVTVRSINRSIDLGAAGTRRLDRFLEESIKGRRGEILINNVTGNTFNIAARNSVFNVTSRLKNGIDLSKLVYRNEALANGKVAATINRGLILNRSAKEIADTVRKYIHPNVPGGQSYAAMRLGRTEINNAFHQTTIDAAKNEPWVEGFKWNLSASHSHPDPCNDYATQDDDDLGSGVFKRSNVPAKPHPQCLCYITAITVDIDVFINNLVGGKYNKWINNWA